MEFTLLHHVTAAHPLLELSQITAAQREQILSVVFLLITHLLDPLLDELAQLNKHGEEGYDFDQYDQRVPDLHVVLRLQTRDHSLGELVVPLVAHVSVILVAHVAQTVGVLVADAVLHHETGEVGALLLEHVLGAVPAHHRLEHRVQETAVAHRLVLRARGYRIRYVAKQL